MQQVLLYVVLFCRISIMSVYAAFAAVSLAVAAYFGHQLWRTQTDGPTMADLVERSLKNNDEYVNHTRHFSKKQVIKVMHVYSFILKKINKQIIKNRRFRLVYRRRTRRLPFHVPRRCLITVRLLNYAYVNVFISRNMYVNHKYLFPSGP